MSYYHIAIVSSMCIFLSAAPHLPFFSPLPVILCFCFRLFFSRFKSVEEDDVDPISESKYPSLEFTESDDCDISGWQILDLFLEIIDSSINLDRTLKIYHHTFSLFFQPCLHKFGHISPLMIIFTSGDHRPKILSLNKILLRSFSIFWLPSFVSVLPQNRFTDILQFWFRKQFDKLLSLSQYQTKER